MFNKEPKVPRQTNILPIKFDDTNTEKFLLDSLFGIETFKTNPERAWLMNLSRLSDKARYEYNLTCGIMQSFANEKSKKYLNAFLYQDAINHMENALNALTRGVKYYDRLRKSRNNTEKYEKLKPRENFNTVKLLRNAIEHTDEHILEGKIIEGQAHSLFINEDGILLGAFFIDFDTISRIISELHKRTLDIVGVNKL